MTPALAAVVLALSPWTGPSLPTAGAAAAKYTLTVHGPSNRDVQLRAGGLPSGWVASFCTKSVCSPFRYDMRLDARGAGAVEFAMIRTGEHAPRHVHVRISAEGARPITLSL